MNRLLTLILLAASTLLVRAQDSPQDTTLLLEVQVRPRSEWRDGYKVVRSAGDARELHTDQRTRIGLTAGVGKFSAKAGFQDVRLWSNDGNSGTQGLYEAWVRWQVRPNAMVTAGRQRISLDTERILGGLDWSQTGRFLDGISLETRGESATTLLAITTDAATRSTQFILHHAWSSARTRLSGLIFQIAGADASFSGFTAGATARHDFDAGWWLEAEAYGQKWSDAGAWGTYGTGTLGRVWSDAHKTLLSIDRLSDAASGAAFSPFLGTNHRHYGWIDHFYVGGDADGLLDGQIRHDIHRQSALWTARFHHFRVPSSGAILGNELDLGLTLKPAPGVVFQIGGALFAATRDHHERQGAFFPNSASDRLQRWAWTSLSIHPQIRIR